MGASSSSQERQVPEPEDLGQFRKNAGIRIGDTYLIPEIPAKRKVTDFKFTVVFGICLIILVPFLIYTFVQSDLDRFIHGYDKCGNICGEKNSRVGDVSCSGQDKTYQPFLRLIKNEHAYSDDDQLFIRDECVRECGSGYVELFNRCFPSKSNDSPRVNRDMETTFADIGRDINKSAGYIVLMCLLGLVFTVGMLFLFRYFVAVVVWVILIGSLLGIIALAIIFWVLNSREATGPNAASAQFFAIFFTILAVILTIVLICMFKRIKLIIRLFKEAIKVIFGIPIIVFEPLLTFVASSIVLIIFVYFLIVMSTAGVLQKTFFDVYEYTPNVAILFTMFFHIVICLWMWQFIIGCQHMVISGAVSSYYFARDKSSLVSPVYTSFYNLIRYHLGSVIFGSLIITVIAIVRALIRGLVNNKSARILVDCCLGAIEDFLKFLSKNAYILTAMHGQPFFKSGKRAVRLLAANALSTIALNSVGDFVLAMSKILIVVATILVGCLMADPTIEHFWAAILISAIVTAIVADCFFAVFETAIDTIFLCFCEDSCMNDGTERPYYMSVNLMQYVEEAKKATNNKN
ncbi:choline transporter-like protein 1 [Tribolium castaneum]|uniref:Choline transporter-like protein n=1 Tax=Tribolium castaneum TaxID=7070 RepID=D6WGP1_TRICA|nr:PREDICTED: choline transporter-like protein 1 [Tribolium castaneum]XP_008198994.1 PREDICTED: choline transporter-like protein 1 [Tribolium castaneum]EFA01113.1 CTL-like protein 1 [Tribolium castaneum]|eukprot:XP_008198993.1 PREDICTED: choline transporter-like protein 1 [Tribolium castaneum]